jgi:hypothetical protein
MIDRKASRYRASSSLIRVPISSSRAPSAQYSRNRRVCSGWWGLTRHLLLEQRVQAVARVRKPGDVLGNVQYRRGVDHAVEKIAHELLLAPEVEQHEGVTYVRLRRHGANREPPDPLAACDLERRPKDHFPPRFLRHA